MVCNLAGPPGPVDRHAPGRSALAGPADPRVSAWRGRYLAGPVDQAHIKEKKRIKTIDTAARDRTIYTKAVNFRNSKREVKNHVQDGKR